MRSSCRFPDTCPELNKAFQAISSPMPLKTQQTVDWQAACILQSGPGARAYKGNAGDGRRSRAEHAVVLQKGWVMLPMLRTRFRLPPASCPAFQPRDLKELTTSEAAQILTVQM